jgi:hypothetical protein
MQVESEPNKAAKSRLESWRDRLGSWPAAIFLLIVGVLILVTGAVLIWLVITTLGAFLRTIF